MHRATYSPEDNKLRIYPECRLDKDVYLRLKNNGFIWAPKQELFVAPMWTPTREDICLELCGEIEDEDKSLVERAEERNQRFESYSENRRKDAETAKAAVSAIAENIPFGQPILVGHHSEKRARRHAEKIQNGMERAVRMWDQSDYWKERARGVLRHAEYKADRFATARRIKKLESDLRKSKNTIHEAEICFKMWNLDFHMKDKDHDTLLDRARYLADRIPLGSHITCSHGKTGDRNYTAYDVLQPDGERWENCPSMTVDEVKDIIQKAMQRTIKQKERWVAHFENRISYEKQLLCESGGLDTDKNKPEKGGALKCWATHSLYNGENYSYIAKVNRTTVSVFDNWGNGGGNFTRNIPFDKCKNILSASEVEAMKILPEFVEFHDKTGFCILKKTEPPKKPESKEHDPEIEAIRESLKTGVQVVSAPQLFPTPPDIARKMVEMADIQFNDRVLEPSAGTGNIAAIIREKLVSFNRIQSGDVMGDYERSHLTCIEINESLSEKLKRFGYNCHCMNFFDFEGEAFEKIIMNPPFKNGEDIKHIKHAFELLRPGGTLVALCAHGPRQMATFRDSAARWEELPEGSFNEQGTNVNVALIVLKK